VRLLTTTAAGIPAGANVGGAEALTGFQAKKHKLCAQKQSLGKALPGLPARRTLYRHDEPILPHGPAVRHKLGELAAASGGMLGAAPVQDRGLAGWPEKHRSPDPYEEDTMSENPASFQVHPIGYARVSDQGMWIEILEPYRPGLKQLEHFSHVHVLWWATEGDTPAARRELQFEPEYAPGVTVGAFACRSPVRPNPIALTTTFLLGVDEAAGVVRVAYVDAFDGTPVLDLKPFVPTSDRPREFYLPPWLAEWPEWQPTEAWEPPVWVDPKG
jgi:tRNA-Thr(GGU) m(6)t(6)A37 methyltransferase TsaA